MTRQSPLSLLYLALWALMALSIGACSDDSDPSDSVTPTDGDEDEATPEDGDTLCTDDERRCDPDNTDVVQQCQNGNWQLWENCVEADQVCENGECVIPADGDEEQDGEAAEPLEILSTLPTQDQEDVPLTTEEVRFNFNQPFQFVGQTLQGAFTLAAEGAPIPSMTANLALPEESLGQGWYNQFRLMFNAPPEAGILYSVTLHDNSFEAENGEHLEPYLLSFRMAGEADGDYEEEVDDTPPDLERSQPSEGQEVDASRDYALLVFTETLNTRNFDERTDVTLTGVPDHTVSLDARMTENDSQMEINFRTPLQAGTAYTLTLEEGLTDLAGNPLGELSLHFSTSSEDTQ